MKKILFLTTLILLIVTACETENGKDKGKTNYSQYFSVSKTKKVQFSPGNLQWSATNGGSTPTTHAVVGGGTEAGTWRFAPNQWDAIGIGNENISSTYTGWIDLFGWGTSGYDNKYPYMTSWHSLDYGNGEISLAGAAANYDWGVYNAIYNPETQTTDAPGTWRTMTKEEWEYLFSRVTLSGIKAARAVVNEVKGLVIVPDNFNSTIYPLRPYAGYMGNNINATDWGKMEAAGCVFLPIASNRSETKVGTFYEIYYWSSTCSGSYGAYGLEFNNNGVRIDVHQRYLGVSVRLVKDVQ